MLKLRHVGHPSSAIWLVEPRVTIGSGASCDLVLNEPGVAERQVEIAVDHEALAMTVMNDGPVVRVNKKVIARPATVALRAGDRLLFGDVELEVFDPKREKNRRPAPVLMPSETGWALRVKQSVAGHRIYPLGQSTLVGRSTRCDIAISAALMSRRHARLFLRNGRLYVRDLGSANGTFLNGSQIVQSPVEHGDELSLGAIDFGVIGPANHMDKTSVRSLLVGSPPAVLVVSSGNRASAPLQHNVAASKAVRPPKDSTGSCFEKDVLGASRRSELNILRVSVVILLVAIVAGLYFSWQTQWAQFWR